MKDCNVGNLYKDGKEEIKRVLEYEIKDINEDIVSVVITKQSHINSAFTKNGSSFKSSNGLSLDSQCYPQMSCMEDRMVFVRGTHSWNHLNEIKMPIKLFKDFKQAVLEYNEDTPTIPTHITEKQRDYIVNKINKHVYEIGDVLTLHIESMKKTTNIKELTRLKGLLLSSMLNLPLSNQHCASCAGTAINVCIAPYESDCLTKCDFMKKNGCCYKDDSRFQKILNIIRELTNLIEEAYR